MAEPEIGWQPLLISENNLAVEKMNMQKQQTRFSGGLFYSLHLYFFILLPNLIWQ